MSRKDDLKKGILESYTIIREYEDIIRIMDRPEEEARSQRQVDRQWRLIEGYLVEYRAIVGDALPDEIAQVAAHIAMGATEMISTWKPLDKPHPPPLDANDVAAYLQVVLEQCCSAETRPYRQLSELRGAPTRLSLLDDDGQSGIYVPLHYDLHPIHRALETERGALLTEDGSRILMEQSRTDVGLRDVLAEDGHLVFIGAAGSGKTTILRLVATVLAAQDIALTQDWLGIQDAPLPLPVFVALRDFENACQKEPGTYRRDVEGLLHFLDDHSQRWHPGRVPHGFVSDLVRAGRAWLLLDALDEVADFDHRIAVRQVIEQLAGEFEGNRLVITARVAAYASANTRLDARFHVATVRDLTREQWVPIVERLYSGFETSADVAAERTRRLIARIDDASQLQEMVKTPLMVWTATLIHYADRELPEQRAELYNAYVDVLLGERLHEQESAEAAQSLREERWSMEDRRLYLTYAAYKSHEWAVEEGGQREKEGALVVVDEHDLVRRILAPFMEDYLGLARRQANREAQAFVSLMAERSGLLYAHQGGYSFGDHLMVQEFLVASYLADEVRGTPDWLSFLREQVGKSWWREVFLLVAGYLLRHPRQVKRFLEDELGSLPGEDDFHAYGLAWAGRALLEIPPRRVGWYARARDELARRLVRVLWCNPPQTSVAARVEVGDVLGSLGDPRFSGKYCLPEFIPIPGGRVWMGSDEAEVERLVQETGEDWFNLELPRHQVEVSGFALARYPTTNTMYACFAEAGGYADARWWEDAIADGRWADGKVKDFSGTRDRRAYWDDEHLNNPNQPVVGITWYEAMAYCRWLTSVLDDRHVYRLPSEAEWECAARGESGYRYPWGDDWETGRANTKELGLERTTPVGIFPDGASAGGLLDMAGQVWEWCADWFGEDTYRRRVGHVVKDPAGPKEGKYRVLHGGSWYNDRNSVWCACRNGGNPDRRNDIGGFRVARGSP